MQLKQDFFTQLPGFYSQVTPQGLTDPKWIGWSRDAAHLVGLSQPTESLLAQLAGNKSIDGACYYSQVYSGHQFGGYSPQLGDGRSILIGEAQGPEGSWDVALKGSGLTPYSRQGDGRAVLRSAIREFLISEALYHLHVPTTRALAVIGSTTPVWREQRETAAITVRLAKSHLRFGHFEYFCHSENGSNEKLTQLLHFTIKQHYPHLSCDKAGYKAWFIQVVKDTAKMIAHWQAIGFAHGVMNTDNMSILGDSFDFGPFAFLDTFKEDFICNHSDPQGRYAFNQQPGVGLWNLQRLAQALTPLIASDDLIYALNTYQTELVQHYLCLMRNKLGLYQPYLKRESQAQDDEDLALIGELMKLMQESQLDHTLTWRQFGQITPTQQHVCLRDDFVAKNDFDTWYLRYQNRVGVIDNIEQWQGLRDRANPQYILRNFLAQEAIEAAENGDFSVLEQLHQVLQRPFDEQVNMSAYSRKPTPEEAGIIMSCSS
ncbi:protein adenylyltransferase SelO [Shewanella surugensis]|uniref:Protein nucleotidyltransferase YdiU n=1 Tax=Shewanella surugensis TaxID=212020 RepID=A0ABT0LHZ0_9GAMM|nr:YdiU family protein [Shewanella surugensis]MCL1126741.1 YdiU family protein [Shewanella surugensis]